MRAIDRRLFLNESALLAATASILSQERAEGRPEAREAGKAGEKLRVAVVGVGGQGNSHVNGFSGRLGCEVTVICDADSARIKPAMESARARQGGQEPRYVQDVRKVVEDKDIDVISIATPNHWHALIAIWAMQNGKHVYVEKPVSHNVVEGRRIVDFARKHAKVCQTGTQSRSSKGMRDAIAFLHAGKLGKVKLARGLCYKLRGSIGNTGKGAPPSTLDYNLWCGPASNGPMKRARLHYDWHWVWEYGNGDLGNQGIHEMDKARWGLGKDHLPRSVQSVGGRFGYKDDGETANTQIIDFDYGDCRLVFEVRGLRSESPYPGKASPKSVGPKDRYPGYVGNIWYGEEGYLVCPSYTGGIAYSKDGEVLQKFSGSGDHFGNFIEAVRAGKPSLLNADILEGHLSSAMCHLGNISYRLGEQASYKEKAEWFEHADAARALESTAKHLASHGVALDEVKWGKGPKLELDTKAERFIKNDEANKMLVRESYRKGFELPDPAKG
jgi:predicted dehydrogenase